LSKKKKGKKAVPLSQNFSCSGNLDYSKSRLFVRCSFTSYEPKPCPRFFSKEKCVSSIRPILTARTTLLGRKPVIRPANNFFYVAFKRLRSAHGIVLLSPVMQRRLSALKSDQIGDYRRSFLEINS
jgi:hypothetical protein